VFLCDVLVCFCAMFFEFWVFLSLDNWDLGGRVLCVFVYSISLWLAVGLHGI
jgi:hypothetical protein